MDRNTEIGLFGEKLIEHVERILATMDGLDRDGINWKPTSDNTNSIYVLATHTMENVKQNVMVVLGGAPDDRDRDAEFVARGESAEELLSRWATQRGQIESRLSELGPDILSREYDHPRRGRVTGRELLLNAVAHAAEHAGQTELTRDLYLAQRQ